MNRSDITQLRAQHEALREMIDRCEELADALDAGRVEPVTVLERVAELRMKLAAHNEFEESVMPPVMQDEFRVDDHIHEHRAMYEGLQNPITRELRATLDALRRHIAIEERHLL